MGSSVFENGLNPGLTGRLSGFESMAEAAPSEVVTKQAMILSHGLAVAQLAQVLVSTTSLMKRNHAVAGECAFM